MSSGTLYILSAMAFGLVLPFIKEAFSEWWQVGLIAAGYFALVRLAMHIRDRRLAERN